MNSFSVRVIRNIAGRSTFVKLCLIVIITLLCVIISTRQKHVRKIIVKGWEHMHKKDIILDIMDDVEPPPKSMFFIETSHTLGLNKVTEVEINFRKACTVESTAKAHPNRTIYILYTTPIKHPTKAMLENQRFAALKGLYRLPNVYIRSINVKRFVKDTPLEPLFRKGGKFSTSEFPNVHLSDILRLVVLWRYGGTYLDMDMVIMKSFYDLGKNYIAIESFQDTNKVNSAVSNLDNKGIGREITEACMKELSDTFVGDEWADDGPFLVTRVLDRICNTNNLSALGENDCRGFRVLPYWSFHPYSWDDWEYPFEPDYLEEGLQDMERCYAIHLYAHSSDSVPVWKNDSDVLYGILANQYCPDAYGNSGDFF